MTAIPARLFALRRRWDRRSKYLCLLTQLLRFIRLLGLLGLLGIVQTDLGTQSPTSGGRESLTMPKVIRIIRLFRQ